MRASARSEMPSTRLAGVADHSAETTGVLCPQAVRADTPLTRATSKHPKPSSQFPPRVKKAVLNCLAFMLQLQSLLSEMCSTEDVKWLLAKAIVTRRTCLISQFSQIPGWASRESRYNIDTA